MSNKQFEALSAENPPPTTGARYWISDPLDPKLQLEVSKAGKCEWKWRVPGASKREGLGLLSNYSALDARSALNRLKSRAVKAEAHVAANPIAALTRGVKLQGLVEHWFKNVGPNEYQDDTLKQTYGQVRDYFLERKHPSNGGMWKDLPAQAIEGQSRELLKHFDYVKGLKNPTTGKPYTHTVYQCKRWLNIVLRWAASREGIIAYNPMPDAKEMKLGRRGARKRNLDAGGLTALLRELQQAKAEANVPPLHRLAIHLVLLTGIRQGELNKAKWADVKEDRWEIPDNKMDHYDVWLPILPELRAVLDELHELTGDSPFLFPSRKERMTQPVDKKWVSHLVPDFCRDRPKAPKFSAHDLRRTIESRMVDLGITEHLAHFCTGHRAKKGAMRHYQFEEMCNEMPLAFERYYALLDACASGNGVAFMKDFAQERASRNPDHQAALAIRAKYTGKAAANVADLASERAKRQ